MKDTTLIRALGNFIEAKVQLRICIEDAYENHGDDFTLDHVCSSELNQLNSTEQELIAALKRVGISEGELS